jgi:hypothetical protein
MPLLSERTQVLLIFIITFTFTTIEIIENMAADSQIMKVGLGQLIIIISAFPLGVYGLRAAESIVDFNYRFILGFGYIGIALAISWDVFFASPRAGDNPFIAPWILLFAAFLGIVGMYKLLTSFRKEKLNNEHQDNPDGV